MHEALEITVCKIDTEIVIELTGDLDVTSVKILVGPLTEVVQGILAEVTLDTLTFDLRKVDFIDSAGLGLLVNAHKLLAPNGKN